MKKYIKMLSLLLAAALAVSLTGCGDSADGGKDSGSLMAAEELSGLWTDEAGNILRLDTVENTYTYRTWYGRIGSGVLTAAEDGENALQLEFDDFLYDFEASDGGFTLRSQGSGDGESLDGAHFTSGGEIPDIPLEKLDGMWQNCEGETLVIDTSRMQYIACSKEAVSSGTVVDKQDGKGVYLFLNGFAYPRLDVGGRSLELFFATSDTQSPDGSFSGVFYKDAKADEYADIDKKDFVSQDGHMWYFDGVVILCKTKAPHSARITVNEREGERPAGDIADSAVFDACFTVSAENEYDIPAYITQAFREMIKDLEKAVGGACCGVTLQNGILGIAINTKYVFAGIPQNFDMSDIDGMRKYYVSSLERMGSLLDIIAKKPSFFGD